MTTAATTTTTAPKEQVTPPRTARKPTVPPTPKKPPKSVVRYGGKSTGGKGSMHWHVPSRAEITKPAIHRIARRAEVRRISGDLYDITREELNAFLQNLIEKAFLLTDSNRRKTVSSLDVKHALETIGAPHYT
jgi:histone H4